MALICNQVPCRVCRWQNFGVSLSFWEVCVWYWLVECWRVSISCALWRGKWLLVSVRHISNSAWSKKNEGGIPCQCSQICGTDDMMIATTSPERQHLIALWPESLLLWLEGTVESHTAACEHPTPGSVVTWYLEIELKRGSWMEVYWRRVEIWKLKILRWLNSSMYLKLVGLASSSVRVWACTFGTLLRPSS